VAIKEQIFGLRKQRGSLFLGSVEARPVTSDGVVLELELEEDNPAKELIENLMIAANIAVSEYLDKKNFPSIKRVVRSPDRWDKLVQLVKGMGDSLPDKPDARALQLFLMEQRQKDPRHFPDVSLRVVKATRWGLI
jgi:exoribonuclease-2